jgi:hypothetical protein
MDYIAVYRKDEENSQIHLALRPGGNDPGLRVLDTANIRTVSRKENQDGVRMEIGGFSTGANTNSHFSYPPQPRG